MAVVIPRNYSHDLALGHMPQVLIAANAVNGTKGAMGSAYLSQIVSANALPTVAAVRSKIDTLYLYNKHLNFKLFMIPALFTIVLMLITGFLPTLNIVSEKETGTIEQINVTRKQVVFYSCQACSLLAHRLLHHHRLPRIGLGCIWYNACGECRTHLSAGYVACCFLLFVRANHIQLLRNNATSCFGYVVFRGHTFAAFGLVYAHPVHAAGSLSHHVCQSRVLLYRSHAHRVHTWRQPRQHCPPGAGTLRNRTLYGLLGCTELQEEPLKTAIGRLFGM